MQWRATLSRGPAQVLVLAVLAALLVGDGPIPPSGLARTSGPPPPQVARPTATEVPAHAYRVLAEVERRDGRPPPGYVGGRSFGNREGLLPRGQYREYDVHPYVRGQGRGPERIVIDRRSGQAYYTRDHYRTFVPMSRPP